MITLRLNLIFWVLRKDHLWTALWNLIATYKYLVSEVHLYKTYKRGVISYLIKINVESIVLSYQWIACASIILLSFTQKNKDCYTSLRILGRTLHCLRDYVAACIWYGQQLQPMVWQAWERMGLLWHHQYLQLLQLNWIMIFQH